MRRLETCNTGLLGPHCIMASLYVQIYPYIFQRKNTDQQREQIKPQHNYETLDAMDFKYLKLKKHPSLAEENQKRGEGKLED